MKIHTPALPPPHGSLMVFAMILMLVAGLFIAGTASLMSTRALETSYMEVAMKRRISLENSKAFNQQFLLERTFNLTSTVNSPVTGIFNNDWGGVYTGGWTNLHTFASTTLPGTLSTVYPYNYAGFRPASSYLTTMQSTRPGALGDVDPFSAYAFLKTCAPCISGDALVVYRKPAVAVDQIEIADKGAGQSITVEGRAVIRDPDSFFAPSTANPYELPLRTNCLYIQKNTPTRKLYCKDIFNGGSDIPPSNLPAMPSTTGPTPTTTVPADLYDDTLNVINNPSNPDNSLWDFMAREKAAGTGDYVTISSSAPTGTSADPWWIESYLTSAYPSVKPTYLPPAYPSGYGATYNVLYITLNHPNLTHMRILGVVDQIVLIGQSTTGTAYADAAKLPPIIITTVPNGSSNSFINLQCVNQNNRRLVLGVQDTNRSNLDIYWAGLPATGFALWRMVLINEYRTVWANFADGTAATKKLKIIGGVMTNWSFKRRISGRPERLTLTPDYTPEPVGATGSRYSSLLPRDGWMENYFLPTPP